MDTPITRAEHEEFRRRMEEEHRRQDKRIELLEESTQQINAIATSVEKLALNLENMCKEQIQQGKRLEELESRDGKTWRNIVEHCLTVAVGIVVGYIFTRLGF